MQWECVEERGASWAFFFFGGGGVGGIIVKSVMYQSKVDVDMLNTVKSLLADVSSVSTSEQKINCSSRSFKLWRSMIGWLHNEFYVAKNKPYLLQLLHSIALVLTWMWVVQLKFVIRTPWLLCTKLQIGKESKPWFKNEIVIVYENKPPV